MWRWGGRCKFLGKHSVNTVIDTWPRYLSQSVSQPDHQPHGLPQTFTLLTSRFRVQAHSVDTSTLKGDNETKSKHFRNKNSNSGDLRSTRSAFHHSPCPCAIRTQHEDVRSGGKVPQVLNFAARLEWPAPYRRRFVPWDKGPCTYCIGGLVGRRGGLDAVNKRLMPLTGIEPRLLDGPVTIITELCRSYMPFILPSINNWSSLKCGHFFFLDYFLFENHLIPL